MASKSVRSRITARGDIRYLLDGEADAILAAEKTINGPIAWRQASANDVRMDVLVENALGENVSLTGRISAKRPGTSGWVLLWGRKDASEHPASIRRLDLRGSHRNPDGTRWWSETHKHLWSEAENNRQAYTPDDIPHDLDGTAVTHDNYREIFEAFAAECGVDLGPDYIWQEPTFALPADQLEIWEKP